jgi:hypothetical protein
VSGVGADAMFCLGFADGMSQILDANCQVAKVTGTASPTGIAPLAVERPPSNAAAVQAFVGWARAHPEFGQTPFGTGVLLALMAAFPCATS